MLKVNREPGPGWPHAIQKLAPPLLDSGHNRERLIMEV